MSVPRDGVLVDANVLVYANDGSEPEKQRRARSVILAVFESGRGFVSTQVLAEYYVTITRLFERYSEADSTWAAVTEIGRGMTLLGIDARVLHEAGWGARRWGMHFYDAQIWAVAKVNDIPVVLSEDFSAGTEIEGVRFIDPFDPDFDPARDLRL